MTDHTVDKVALATGAHFNKLTPAALTTGENDD